MLCAAGIRDEQCNHRKRVGVRPGMGPGSWHGWVCWDGVMREPEGVTPEPSRVFIPAETLVQNGTAGDNSTAGGP